MTTTVLVRFESRSEASAAEVLRLLGFNENPHPRCRWFREELLWAEAEGALRQETLDRIGRTGGVQKVVTLNSERRLSALPVDCTVTLPNGARFGDGGVSVIAGPCSVESESQVCEIAEMVKAAGARALRGGAFKPRTSPYSFGGLGEKGLEYMARARDKTGLPIVTEALDTANIPLVDRYADVIQIGSRNMHHSTLLFEVGAVPSGKPILLKRGFAATLDELLLAAEYVLLGRLYAGSKAPNLILCERGIRTFEQSTRFTLDIGVIPALKRSSPLPVVVDPSHAAGQRRYVRPLARAAVAAGADGLLVEVHTDPAKAWSDGAQCVDGEDFRALVSEANAIAGVCRR